MPHRVSLLSVAALAVVSSSVFGVENVGVSKPVVAVVSKEAASGSERDVLVSKYYKITEIKGPQGVDPQVGALCAMPDGRMAVAFHRGEVAFYNPANNEWSMFAEGLHEPLGMLNEPDGSLLVMQRPELTRLRDTKGSGKADSYETVWDGFGLSGNYHEFAFGPVRNAQGKFFVGLNLASSGDTVNQEVRGQWLPIGLDRKDFYGDWKKNGKLAGRMYSRVPWRGWIMEVDPVSGKAKPFASGFRSPDGLGLDAEGNLIVSDNQGDWRGSSELHVVERGGFYGHPASLPWRADWGKQPPLETPIEKLNKLRTPAAVWFPHMSYANSPTQMVRIPQTAAWGPYGGQIVIGEMNVPKLLRVTTEKVNGVWQGACYPFIETPALKPGLHRLAFLGDKLWVGRTHLSWAGGENFGVVERIGNSPLDALEINLTKTGFKVHFTQSLSASCNNKTLWSIRRYTYAYHAEYGSPELEEQWMTPSDVILTEDGRCAELILPELQENFVYDFFFDKLYTDKGLVPLNNRVAYTLRKKF
jgi:Glucose / Sorbosone dehydrogenase